MFSVENVLVSSFEELKINDDKMNEYDILLKNIKILDKKKYTKDLASKLHVKNIEYKKNIVFEAFNTDQMNIRNQLAKCLMFDPKIDHVIYCLNTKKLLNIILTFIQS
jgi:hypothetical protein